MKVVMTDDADAVISMDVVEGAWVYLSTGGVYLEWESLTPSEQAKWSEASRIISGAVSQAVALISPSIDVRTIAEHELSTVLTRPASAVPVQATY